MTENRLIQSILPEAQLESQEFQDGVIEGFHAAAHDIVMSGILKQNKLMSDEEAVELIKVVQKHLSHERQHPDWYAGWLAGYAVRRGNYERQALTRLESSDNGQPGSGSNNDPLPTAQRPE